MDRPTERLDYESVADAPRRPGVGERIIRSVLSVVGIAWFLFFTFGAVMGFLMRDLGSEPGSPMTVGKALPFAIATGLIGLLGLVFAFAAQRVGR